MNPELRLLLFISRHLPPIKGAGVVGNILKSWYTRKPRKKVQIGVLGNSMELEPSENVDGELLFYPQLYDREERRLMSETLSPGDTFVDIGANIGIYSLLAAQCVGNKGRVLAIEADPYNYAKLKKNCSLSKASNVDAINIGVSDAKETLSMALNTTGNRGGNSFLPGLVESGRELIEVVCLPLMDIFRREKMYSVKMAKLDIEGFEYRVLKKFLEDGEKKRWPQYLIIEHGADQVAEAGGDAIELLKSHGYVVKQKTSLNYIMQLSDKLSQ